MKGMFNNGKLLTGQLKGQGYEHIREFYINIIIL